ncbi:hypothetical protein [Corallococcus aberystwythensis]|uniref:Uncharacterized protein n=1 Tax=Corallococcus aberystwythensis TaxID=2316722 RepID=A0A3A8QB99_9BACT|nr:hypothetical protein [Corallococcus aberystwythensis]RKH64300.1 hypothetical protein D7W81_18875 [Corallococcus aberystwythensis]
MRSARFLAAVVGTLLISGTPITAAVREPASDAQTRAEARTSGTTLEIDWDQPMPAAESEALTKSLQGAAEEENVQTFMPKPNGHGPQYDVVKCDKANHIFTDRNGIFSVRYNCRFNNVNWGFKVSPKLVTIAIGDMKESGMVWHTATRKLGQNGHHTVPIYYQLHGTQGGVKDGDILHWSDRLTFRVNAGGREGTAVLNIGGTFKISRR